MKKKIYRLSVLLSLAVILFAGCERQGWDEEKLYVKKTFLPVTDVSGEGGYGRAVLKWQLPDSTSSLDYVNVRWEDAGNHAGNKVFSKFLDSVCISGLEESTYTFEVISCDETGEQKVALPQTLVVLDWQKEPTVAVKNFKEMVAENFLFLNWEHPQHPTYVAIRLQLYKGELLEKEKTVTKTENPEYTFDNLDYTTTYKLVYYSVNLKDSLSGRGEYVFETGMIAPAVPEIIIGTRTAYAHSTDIAWTPTADMDSVLIKYKDLKGTTREYRFGAESGAGYLSVLPGGTINVDVQARGTNGTWALPKEQKIKTKLKEEICPIKDGKVRECLEENLGHKAPAGFSFEELSTVKNVIMKYQIEKIDELELLVNLEILQMTASYPPGLNASPTVEAFLNLISRLPNIKELRVQKGWPRSADLQKAFQNHPKVKFTLN